MIASLRTCALALLACGLTLSSPVASWAQDYPNKTVRIIVPFGAGGPADVFSRQLAQHLSESLKPSFVVEAGVLARLDPAPLPVLPSNTAHWGGCLTPGSIFSRAARADP